MLTFDEATHTYWIGAAKVPSVTQILKPLVDLSSIPSGVLAHASARGTAVHYACELFDQDNLDWDSLDVELVPYVEAWVEFRMATGFMPIRNEERVFHPGLFYAGTLDRTGLINGELSVVDIKTSSGLYPTVGMQLAAYAEALNATNANATEPKHTGRYAVQLKKDGRYHLQPYTDKTDWPVFVSLKTLITWSDKNKTRIHHEPN